MSILSLPSLARSSSPSLLPTSQKLCLDTLDGQRLAVRLIESLKRIHRQPFISVYPICRICDILSYNLSGCRRDFDALSTIRDQISPVRTHRLLKCIGPEKHFRFGDGCIDAPHRGIRLLQPHKQEDAVGMQLRADLPSINGHDIHPHQTIHLGGGTRVEEMQFRRQLAPRAPDRARRGLGAEPRICETQDRGADQLLQQAGGALKARGCQCGTGLGEVVVLATPSPLVGQQLPDPARTQAREMGRSIDHGYHVKSQRAFKRQTLEARREGAEDFSQAR